MSNLENIRRAARERRAEPQEANEQTNDTTGSETSERPTTRAGTTGKDKESGHVRSKNKADK